MTGVEIPGQHGLHLDGQAFEAAAHVGNAGGQPYSRVRARADHVLWRSARNTLHRLASSTGQRRRSTAPAMSSSMVPALRDTR